MYEIIGETIKSATSIKLGQIFNNPHRYKENITNMEYPNFMIIQVDLNVTSQQIIRHSIENNPKKKLQLDYLMNIQYRVAENTEGITNLQQQLDNIGLQLCSEFDEIDLELPVKVKNAYYEKIDGVLQFFFNITIFVTPENPNDVLMQELELDESVEEEE